MSEYLINLQIPIALVRDSLADLDANLHRSISSRCGIGRDCIKGYKILSKSIDARKKRNIKINYQVAAEFSENAEKPAKAEPYKPKPDNYLENLRTSASPVKNPIIVGAGPAGLLAGLVLAETGCDPVILDRGCPVEQRDADIKDFFRTRKLNPESNFLFGEGGAGTYSDGKLYTRVKDPRIKFILKNFVAAGAQEEVLYVKRPHLGSDRLPGIVSNLRKRIISLGGKFRWNAKVTGIIAESGICKGVVLDNGEKLSAPSVLIAPGHSARNFLRTLAGKLDFIPKGFQIGCRIEHPQNFINKMQYGFGQSKPGLGAAEYNMVSRPPESSGVAGATSFCMCPGGEIIPAVNVDGQLSTNGMSRLARNGKFGNAGLIAGCDPSLFSSPFEAFDFLDNLEREAFKTGGGEFTAPGQSGKAFIQGKAELSGTESSYRLGLKPARLDLLLPNRAADALKAALRHFDRVAPGFASSGVLIGIESRVSSPLRFVRNPETLETSAKNLYMAGEGAGFAGGIISAAIDGMKMAEQIIRKKI